MLLDSMLEGEGFFPNDENICQLGHRAMKENRRAAPAQPDYCQFREKAWNGDRTSSRRVCLDYWTIGREMWL